MADANNVLQVFVRIDGLVTSTIRLNANASVQDVAEKIATRAQVRCDQILLQYGQKPLRHGTKITDYNIRSESTLDATVKNVIKREDLIDGEKLVNKDLLELDKEYKARIRLTKSLCTLMTVKEDIDSDYCQQRKSLICDKLMILNKLNTSDAAKRSGLQREIDSIEQERKNNCSKIVEREEEIRRLELIIEQLKSEKTTFLEKNIESEKEYKIKSKKIEDITSKIDANEAKISNTKQELQDLNTKQESEALSESLKSALTEMENEFTGWSTKEVIAWIRLIENGKFYHRKYMRMAKEIEQLEISGKSFKDLRNNSLLRLIGGDAVNSNDRTLLITNVDRVLNGHKEKQQKTNCTICVVAGINSVFIPCGHQSVCFDCYQKQKNRFKECPICRANITNVMKTYMNGF